MKTPRAPQGREPLDTVAHPWLSLHGGKLNPLFAKKVDGLVQGESKSRVFDLLVAGSSHVDLSKRLFAPNKVSNLFGQIALVHDDFASRLATWRTQ